MQRKTTTRPILAVLVCYHPIHPQEGEGYEMYWRMQKSFGEVSNLAITFDTIKFGAGYGLMFAYASFMLGKPNLVEQRVYLAGSGIVGVAMGVVIAMGLTMLMGFFYTPLHGVMVYLCLGLPALSTSLLLCTSTYYGSLISCTDSGIGIDDMFVIMQCWDNLFSSGDKATKEIPLAKRIGKTMKHAGVAITVTSATDMVAFAVGSVTVSEWRDE